MQKISLRERARQELQTRMILQDPLKLARQQFGLNPNEEQTRFLRDIQNPGLMNYILQAPRGGGKTIICAASVLWGALNIPRITGHPFQALILSGAFEQTEQFYSHVKRFISLMPQLQAMVDGEPKISKTHFKDGGVIKCLTSSEKTTRSPHVDWLYIDEFVQVERDLIAAAFPTVNTSDIPKRVFLSTASQTKGAVSLDVWYEWWDAAEELELIRYQWEKDACPWINPTDADLAKKYLDKINPVLYATEYLGQREERVGAVFKRSQINYAVESAADYNYAPELPCMAGVDWGFVHPTVVTVVQPQGEHVIVVYVEGRHMKDINWWCYRLQKIRQAYNVLAFYCDNSHKFNNEQLITLNEPVAPVKFQKDKDSMIGETRRLLEYTLLKIPEHFPGHPQMLDNDLFESVSFDSEFQKTIKQLKNYTYDTEKETPLKQNDDYVDSIMLANWGVKQGDAFSIGRFM